MNLKNKKQLISKVMGIGKDRIILMPERMEEIKEIMTRADVKKLEKERIILIKPKKGKRRKKRRGKRTSKKKVKRRKKDYVKLTRKLRKYVGELKKSGRLDKENAKELKRKIRQKRFRSKASLKNFLEEGKK